MDKKSPKKFSTVADAEAYIEQMKRERAQLEDALIKIAVGNGFYGTMAREYKNIARVALGQPTL